MEILQREEAKPNFKFYVYPGKPIKTSPESQFEWFLIDWDKYPVQLSLQSHQDILEEYLMLPASPLLHLVGKRKNAISI